ncbi:L,D-transpeptidase [Microbacteriaceae bacterium K1510]|nr:L,D-transpeptidase [Microbacteriaceae bacterium K1510]
MSSSHTVLTAGSFALIAAAFVSGPAQAQTLFSSLVAPQPAQVAPQPLVEEQAAPTDDEDAQLPARLKRQIVDYKSAEARGTVIIDTPHTYLYYVLGNGKALRYGIGVGREGFTWSGVKQITRKAEWPDWYPPAAMIKRQPYLPRMTSGGPGNPLGARAMYIGGTEYRIHGTNAPSTIGKQVSSGCIRLTNEDVIDLFNRVQVGAKVIVLPQTLEAKARLHDRQAQNAPQSIAPQPVSMTRSYAPSESAASRAWTTIH